MASIFSMTGYGKVETAFNNHTIVIELRSVNNRYLDITTKIPKNLSHIENDLRNQIKNKVARGSVFLSILMDSGETEISLPRTMKPQSKHLLILLMILKISLISKAMSI